MRKVFLLYALGLYQVTENEGKVYFWLSVLIGYWHIVT